MYKFVDLELFRDLIVVERGCLPSCCFWQSLPRELEFRFELSQFIFVHGIRAKPIVILGLPSVGIHVILFTLRMFDRRGRGDS